MNLLDSLKTHTTVVADTGDFNAVRQYRPVDGTTNPSLIYQAAQKPEYAHLVDDAVRYAAKSPGGRAARRAAGIDRLIVNFGCEMLRIVPGRVSTEVDAALSFDTSGTVARARRLMGLYEEAGIGRERVLIKIASTWEGIRAARMLEREGIHCNLTLLFSLAQAVACADAGVASVTRIYHYYKKFGYPTQVMGASFRTVDQIVRLAGCDLLTISPDLLERMRATPGDVARRLSVENARASAETRIRLTEKKFRWMHNEDAMASDKLSEGIRKFNADTRRLEQFARGRMEIARAA